jgi:NADH dehydrogenase [ubiquinone] 1 alpha subcomplex assembly factor 1
MILFDFNAQSDLSDWAIVDDVVMGGRSQGQFGLDEEGNAVFRGRVSLENNGGFSSVRYRFRTKDVGPHSHFKIRVKGDGNRYQFRAKSGLYDRHSYICYFETTGEWQTIEIPMEEMYPTFRGMKLNMENYPGTDLSEIAFLIGNKKAQGFELRIDRVEVE